jgi:short-chain fatty acids transporter
LGYEAFLRLGRDFWREHLEVMSLLNRLSYRLAQWARQVVPNTLVLAIFLSCITCCLCLIWTPLGVLELGQIWVGEGTHRLMRMEGGQIKPWVVQKIEAKEKGRWRLVIHRRSSPLEVAAVFQGQEPYRVLYVERNALWIQGGDRASLERKLAVLQVRARIKGIWHFLAFAMQMCLILLTGYALAVSKPLMRVVRFLASLPRDGGVAAAWVACLSRVGGWLNWGFGLVLGAYFAREVARCGEERGIAMHYPLLGAAGYTAMLIWHGGLSGSAPLKVAEAQHLSRELGLSLAPIPLQQTIFSPMNLAVTLGLLIAIPLLCRAMMPLDTRESLPFSHFVDAPSHGVPLLDQRSNALDQARWINWLLAFPMLGMFFWQWSSGVPLSINAMILLFFSLGLLLHRGPRAYLLAAAEGGRGCIGIMIQFPLYAGIFALVYEAGLLERMSLWIASVSSPSGFLISSFLSAGLLNLFVPSGGGQWGMQGAVVLQAAEALKIPLGTAVMTVAYGDQWTNMLQPFWALALLEITGLRARDIVGYTILLMFASGLLFAMALLLFGRFF